MKKTNKMNKTVKSVKSEVEPIDSYINEFQGSMALGIQSIYAAACIYVAALKKFPTNGDKTFRERFPKVGNDTWRILELIGSNKLVPDAYMMNRTVAMRFSSIPLKQQKILIESKGVAVVSQSTLKKLDDPVDVCDLSTQQAQVVIDEKKKRIRTVNEQIKYIKKAASSCITRKRIEKKQWEIRGKILVVFEPCSFDEKTLKEIIGKISDNKKSK